MKTPENFVKDRIRRHLKSLGAYCFSPVQMGLGVSTLDLLCCVNGRFVAIEVKREGGKPTARQINVMDQIVEAGGIAFCCDSHDAYMANMKHFGAVDTGVIRDPGFRSSVT